MTTPRSNFERFLAKVHRRYLALGLVERAGLGLLASCAAGLPLVVLAIWKGIPAGPLAVGALGLGALGGFLVGLLHRPTLHDTATEADRQLETSDLLSTALAVQHNPDPWAGAVIASADRWSQTAAPSSVILNRLGARAWGGIGLATALVLVLTLLPTYATPIQAADPSTNGSNPAHGTDSSYAAANNPRRSTPEQNPEDLRTNPQAADGPASRPEGSTESRNDNGRQNPGRDAASGRGESHTPSKSDPLKNATDSTQARRASPTGRSTDGAGRAAKNAASGNSDASQVGDSELSTLLAPWKSSEWPQQAQQAIHAVDSGQVPAAYRDVIQGYFERH